MAGYTAVAGNERIAVLDVLRGAALFGILLVNMEAFYAPVIYRDMLYSRDWQEGLDGAAEFAMLFFAKGKFYTMFSFLFGLGFVLWMERAARKTKRPEWLYVRRMLVLLAFGLIHALFIWWGDILVAYALSGSALILFNRLKPRALLWFAALFTALYLALTAVWIAAFAGAAEDPAVREQINRLAQEAQENMASSHQAYAHGTVQDIFSQRFRDAQIMFGSLPYTLLLVLPMFLLGAYAGKKKMYLADPQNIRQIKRIWAVCGVVGLLLSAGKLAAMYKTDPLSPSLFSLWDEIGMAIGDPALSLFYVCSLFLLFHTTTRGRRWLLPLAPAGRAPLSNYLLQSLVCTTLFYSYGFGWYGSITPAAGTALAIVIFLAQLAASHVWFRRFSFGPLERLWRMLAYGGIGSR